MKLYRLFTLAAVALTALVSCNKEELTPQDTSLKSVQISLDNIIMTKGMAGDKITANDKVKVTDFKIFLTDDTYSPAYSAKNADGSEATFYFNAASDLTEIKQFHFVDHKCTKVVIVANVGNISFEEVLKLNVPIADQQLQTGLVLYGEQNLTATGRVHTQEGTDKYTEVYEAKVTMKPAIARFEVDGFVTKFSENPKFNKISVQAVAFQNYFPALTANTNGGKLNILGTGTEVKHIVNLDNDSQVYNWLNGSASNGWFIDRFDPVLDMTKDDPVADTPNNLAYHFYAGEAVPQMLVSLLADGTPAYIYTSKFYKGTEPLTKLEAGKIYRMSAAGDVETDGSIEIPDDLSPIQRCVEIKVEVVEWTVDIITPEF